MNDRQQTKHYSKLLHIHGPPKIRKNDIPLRPIVRHRGSVRSPLTRFPCGVSHPLTAKGSSYVKNCAHFLEINNKAAIHSDQIVSQNEVSLFIRVTTDETTTVLQDKQETG